VYSTPWLDPIQNGVSATWIFERDAHRLRLHRHAGQRDRSVLVVALDDAPARSYSFADACTLVHFQADMEQFLVATGWSLREFSHDSPAEGPPAHANPREWT
jgi:hypothetical protein